MTPTTSLTRVSLFHTLALLASTPLIFGKALMPGPVPRDGITSSPNVSLDTGMFTHVQSKLKGGDDKGWGGYGWNMWDFIFKGTYTAEDFTITYFDSSASAAFEAWQAVEMGSQTPTGTSPVACHMTATATLTDYPTFTVLPTSPWISPASAGVVTAACTPGTA